MRLLQRQSSTYNGQKAIERIYLLGVLRWKQPCLQLGSRFPVTRLQEEKFLHRVVLIMAAPELTSGEDGFTSQNYSSEPMAGFIHHIDDLKFRPRLLGSNLLTNSEYSTSLLERLSVCQSQIPSAGNPHHSHVSERESQAAVFMISIYVPPHT